MHIFSQRMPDSQRPRPLTGRSRGEAAAEEGLFCGKMRAAHFATKQTLFSERRRREVGNQTHS
jgi:hypothetical protein